jgi:DNA-binding transcriptional MerR regulator
VILEHNDQVFLLERQIMRISRAAEAAHVTPQTIHGWITRGYLNASGERAFVTAHIEDGRRYVILADVLRAEAVTSTRGRGRTRARPELPPRVAA